MGVTFSFFLFLGLSGEKTIQLDNSRAMVVVLFVVNQHQVLMALASQPTGLLMTNPWILTLLFSPWFHQESCYPVCYLSLQPFFANLLFQHVPYKLERSVSAVCVQFHTILQSPTVLV
uniref:Uncharacterized protein n=1 Tax=Eutreptiella gymnastica TaxID=73025 RepID=A0A7S4D0Z7_9EUGL|mmetsp:Transcript_107589/g.181940  ORF Transcript_107589/g.181940 Transcript_107589/m.181940 type:complete len:118 (+) Transcript_107589:515-868(+)